MQNGIRTFRRTFSSCICLYRQHKASSGRLRTAVQTRYLDELPAKANISRGMSGTGFSKRTRAKGHFGGNFRMGRSPPPEKLPFYKFVPMLGFRCKRLRTTGQLDDIMEEMGLPPDKISLFDGYKYKLMGQPPSTYEGVTKSGREARSWKPSPGVPSLHQLKIAYEGSGLQGLDSAIVSGFRMYCSITMLGPEEVERQLKMADCSRPAEWFPLARTMTRKLHLHVGPTNSGKTYHALQRLKNARSGVFAGPLRLLAFEVYERFNREGVPCNLATGEERRITEGVMLSSSTIEMLNYQQEIDVLVIDEIQMLADEGRGSAWTHALLGAPAKEIHMCGEASVVDLVKAIAETLGETVEVHEYHRLGGLEPLQESLGGTFQAIEPGDAVVTFSRQDIFDVKKNIEASSKYKCAVVYGGLPPETRAAQAQLFNNEENDFKVMVASDAIGMGLNLSITRVIFETLQKWDGKALTRLSIPQVKQIAGRAGRFKAKSKDVECDGIDPPKDIPGYVTTLRASDLPYLHEALATPTVQLKKATLEPVSDVIERFIRPYPTKMRLSVAMQQFQAFSKTSEVYSLRDVSTKNDVLDLLHPIRGLSFQDRWTLTLAPVKARDPQCIKAFLQMAKAIGDGTTGDVLGMSEFTIDELDEGVPKSHEMLLKLESLHSQLTMYSWLSLRFPGVFHSAIETYQLKEYTEGLIEEGLNTLAVKKSGGGVSARFISNAMRARAGMRKQQEIRGFGMRTDRPPRPSARL